MAEGVASQAQKRTANINSLVDDIPLHLRPYNGTKYEVPSKKLKLTTGFSFLDVEPVPRAKIMKISYLIMEKLKVLPEDALYRIYTEEKVKYIMRLTDSIEDIQVLEQELGFESIEHFIQCYHGEIRLAELMKQYKPWAMSAEDDAETIDVLR